MKSERVSDIKATLCLPRTPFSMRAHLPALEHELLARWKSMALYPSLLEQRAGAPVFTVLDGPPYASGALQWGHILNKILKDFVLRSHAMVGERCEFIPGWDCHGLPIELEIDQQAGSVLSAEDKLEIRRACRVYAEQSIEVQKAQFQRLGLLGHWEQAYVTMSPAYQAAITRALAALVRSESLVQRTRPVFWCGSCETALAEFEVSFQPRQSPEAYFAFPLISDPIHLDRNLRGRDVEIVSWTSHVWMIPGVMALGVDPEAMYVAVRMHRKIYLVAEQCLATVAQACQWGPEPEVIHHLPGSALVSLSCRHPLIHRQLPVLDVPHMRMTQGSGVAQICPGHDPTYYDVAMEHQLEMYSPVDERGRFTQQVENFLGQSVWDVEPRILQRLQEMDALLSPPTWAVEHNYPHCWRCEQAVLFRATPQWFVPMDTHNLRQRALDALAEIEWLPAWGYKRMASLLQRRTDWCLSRQRVWGVPLPIFYCTRCREPLLDPEHIEHLASRYEADPDGADLWFREPVEALLPQRDEELCCYRCGNNKFRKEEDIVDVWFDSGISAWAVLPQTTSDGPLADMVLEGVDQFRGWFQGSLLSTLQLMKRLPFRTVLAHGRIVGESPPMTAEQESVQAVAQRLKEQGTGRDTPAPLSVASPQSTVERWGAELLRLWVASEDCQKHRALEVRDSRHLSHAYRKVRNCFRFMLANLYDFDLSRDLIEWELMEDVDRYALHLLHHKVASIRACYAANKFHSVWRNVLSFCVDDLSGFYFEVLKDRLYASAPDWYVRRSAQNTLYRLADALCRCVAPILCFTAEEVWQYLPGERESSVHWALLPEPEEIPTSSDQAEIWQGLRLARKQVLRAFTSLKKDLHLKRSWDASVRLYPHTERLREALELCDEQQLPYILGVSQASVVEKDRPTPREAWRSSWGSLAVEVRRAEGRRCRRCRFVFKELQHAGPRAMCSRCQRAVDQQQASSSHTHTSPPTQSSNG